jgi:hypothetical protein
MNELDISGKLLAVPVSQRKEELLSDVYSGHRLARSTILSSPLTKRWRMLWVFQSSELNACSNHAVWTLFVWRYRQVIANLAIILGAGTKKCVPIRPSLPHWIFRFNLHFPIHCPFPYFCTIFYDSTISQWLCTKRTADTEKRQQKLLRIFTQMTFGFVKHGWIWKIGILERSHPPPPPAIARHSRPTPSFSNTAPELAISAASMIVFSRQM